MIKKPFLKTKLHIADYALKKIFGKSYQQLRNTVKNKIKYAGVVKGNATTLNSRGIFSELCWSYELPVVQDMPLVSVIVPYSQSANNLRERLDSIYNQTYSNIEVLLLMDAANSTYEAILTEYASVYPEKTLVSRISQSSTSIIQWNHGIQKAHGRYIWIAENNGYCDMDFLEKLVPLLDYESVMVAFSKNISLNKEMQMTNDFSEIQWEHSFMMTAHIAVRKVFGTKNIIPNISSMIFRNIGKIPENIIEVSNDMIFHTHWLFCLELIKGGCLSFTNETTSYQRSNVSLSKISDAESTEQYQVEYNMVTAFAAKNFALEKYSLYSKLPPPNVLMCCCSFMLGGGETYALYLANEMKRQGVPITVLDFHMSGYDEGVRGILRSDIPVVKIPDLNALYSIVEQLGVDIIHSHHGNVDEAIAMCMLHAEFRCKQIITLHGMYEAMPEMDCQYLLNKVSKTCSQFIYISDKNLDPFRQYGYLEQVNLVKMANGLPKMTVQLIERQSLGIEADAWVLCLVSRGIPEKGWQEGIAAVELAREQTGRHIHLVILGDGEVRKKLESTAPPYIHFIGSVQNVRDYYAMSDIGFLPSRFRGESYPLVIIEALLCGKPVIVTDVGEVRNQLMDEFGNLAGELIPLHNWQLDVTEIADIITSWIETKGKYETFASRVPSAAQKFDIEKIVEKYLQLYDKACND